jgi:galactoside O-acetyltransferase
VENADSFFTPQEIAQLSFHFVGDNVKISRHTNFYGSNYISIGSNSRIDDFCILSASEEGSIIIGNHVHISAGVYLYGAAGISIDDYSGLSAGVKIFSVSDDYSGDFMTNPTIGKEFLNVHKAKVIIEKHVVVGTGAVILPGVVISEGTAVGALSIVDKSLSPWGIFVGQPARKIKDRSRQILKLEEKFLESKIENQ